MAEALKASKNATLEDLSLWYFYKVPVWTGEEQLASIIHNTMRVLRSVRGPFNYASTPVSSGKWFYEQSQHRVVSFQETFDHNYNDGYSFVEELCKTLDNVVFPGELVPTEHFKWSQKHFQALWLSIIAEKSENVYMNDGWEFSNGCSEELVHAFQLRLGLPEHSHLAFYNTKESEKVARERMRNIKVFDRQLREIKINDAIWKMDKSIQWLKDRKQSPEQISRARILLERTAELIDKGFYQ